jgi:asparagine synthase (glutamine-hydrolysing)
MCGICGIAARDPRVQPVERATLAAMARVIRHRGPDEDGLHLERGIALGMRRLSIIDLSGSHQPVHTEDRSVSAIFNGEIFNFRELRRVLQSRGHRLASEGDTETIVHLYEDFGAGFVTQLRGMFAIALWDANRDLLLLARDRLGVKPLYWAETDHGLAFASEIKSLIAGGLVTPALDEIAAGQFLSLGYVPGPRTLFKGVFKQPPATVMEWRAGVLDTPHVYWTPEDPPSVAPGTWREDGERLLHLLRQSVRDRLVSDVPVGVMLSGGLDSSLIAALMAEASSDVKTFSVGFERDYGATELSWARQVSRRLGTTHHERQVDAATLWDVVDNAMWHLEEPIADLSFLGLYELSRLTREHVTVALCGQAADELLGGYPKHLVGRVSSLAEYFPQAANRAMIRGTDGLDGRNLAVRALRAFSASTDGDRLLALSRLIGPQVLAALHTSADGIDVEADLATVLSKAQSSRATDSNLMRLLSMDLRLALPDLMFLYFDKMSMAASLEVRVPFADHDVVNFCMALPDDRRIRLPRQGKALLRRVSRGLVDETIINRPKRNFFRSDSSDWLDLHEQAVRDLLLDERTRNRGVVNTAVVEAWLERPRRTSRAAEPLLAVFMLEKWHRIFVDPDGTASSLERVT